VISSFGGGVNFTERVSRLSEYRKIVRLSVEVPALQKRKYLISTYPLVAFGPKFLRFSFTLLFRSGMMSVIPGFRSQRGVFRSLLPRNKALQN
jgi:hypothetical protein